MIPGTKLRDCAVCGNPVTEKPYQSNAARACSPVCAQTLAVREHPDLGSVTESRNRLNYNGSDRGPIGTNE